ncbi:hypothetical protein [Streptomyces sp. NPDC058583]|uniref:hypothetical protein n=1 Tax=unclassified Streptomyces TaxID=2593676 RepID=UPI003662D630
MEATTLRISSTLAVLEVSHVPADTTGRVIEAALLVLPGDRADALFTTHPTTEERTAEEWRPTTSSGSSRGRAPTASPAS